VVVRVASPEGKSLGEFDSPNGDNGPENVSFVAVTAGVYRVNVTLLNPDANTPNGKFEIRLVEVRQATEQAKRAGEEARRAMANIDVAKITREAMAEARTELERECKHAAPAPAGETDSQAIARLSMGCVDMAEIAREVEEGLREATNEIRNDKDLSEADRARALAAIERSRAEMARKMSH